jgi:hypothetical protein
VKRRADDLIRAGLTRDEAERQALGIGANTVVSGVLNALTLKPLPVSSTQELFFLQGNNFGTQSFPNYRDLRDRNSTFSGLVASRHA